MAQTQWEEVESKLWTDGVIAGARNAFVTTTTTGLGISVNTGDAIVDGFRCFADATTALTAATADPSLPRIDLLVFRINESAHTSAIALITGTPSGSPVAPSATKTPGGTYELALYQVRVNAGSTSITSLTDVRTYTSPSIGGLTTGSVVTGFNADLLDGVSGSGYVQVGSHNSISPLKISAGTTLPGTLDSREIFILLA